MALFGLGIAGALCGRHDSEFALFAGGTMTVLLIGMTMGSGSIELAEPAAPSVTTEPELAGLNESEKPQMLSTIIAKIIIGANRPRFFFARDLTGPKTRAIVSAMMGISGLVLPAFTS